MQTIQQLRSAGATFFPSLNENSIRTRFAKLRGLSPQRAVAEVQNGLHLRVLHTPAEREVIASLRKLSASAVEDDLALQLGPLETARDEVGFVSAIFDGTRLVATIRFVPHGYGLTGAERLGPQALPDPVILGTNAWEVGRLIVAPQDRRPELLTSCLTQALIHLVRQRKVEQFYAIATPTMARLWRRFGMHVVARVHGASGNGYTVVCGSVHDVAAALKVDCGCDDLADALPGRMSSWQPQESHALTATL